MDPVDPDSNRKYYKIIESKIIQRKTLDPH